MSTEQKTWLSQVDLLRIIAAFAVVLLHASAHVWYSVPINSADWVIANFYNVLSRFGVPVFVMISGAMFLDPSREISIKKLWLHFILRLAVIYALWSLAYGILHYYQLPSGERSLKVLIKLALSGNYHLWFLPMLMGLYALVPILRKWIRSASNEDFYYFFALFFVFQILRITLRTFLVTKEVLALFDTAVIDLVCGYAGYFILGYWLFHVNLPEKWNKILYFLLPLFYLFNVALGTFQTWHAGELRAEISDSYGIFTFLTSVSIFQLITRKTFQGKKSGSLNPILKTLSQSTFGIYLIHLMVMESPWVLPLFSKLTPLLSIPLITLISFLTCFALATILRKLPLIGRYVC